MSKHEMSRIRTAFVLLIVLASSFGILGLIGGAGAEPDVATVQERADLKYETTIELDEKAKFKWDVYNPTNETYNVTIVIMTDNTDFTGSTDRPKFQVHSGQSDTVIVKVTTDATESDSGKISVEFKLMNINTKEEVSAFKSANVKLLVIHGIDFHGLNLNPESLGLEDNDIWRLALVIFAWFLIACLTYFLMNPMIRWGVRKTKTKIDDVILGIISKPIFVLVILYGILDSIELMDFIPIDLTAILKKIFGLGVLLIMMYLAFKLFKGVLIQFGEEFAAKTDTEIDDVLIPVVEKIGVVFIGIFGLMGILSYFGINLTMAAAGFGIFGLVIAFAAQSSIANFFGGIFVLLDRPFKVGDLILVNNDYCEVKYIGLRSSRIYNVSKHSIIIMPNDELANSVVTNLSAPDQRYKVKVLHEVEYGTDPDTFVEMMIDIVKNAPEDVHIIKDDPDRGVWGRLNSLKESSMEFVVGFWVDDIMKQWSAAGYVRTKLYYLCIEKNIDMPFPRMDIALLNQKKD